jgi:hypothetical protein
LPWSECWVALVCKTSWIVPLFVPLPLTLDCSEQRAITHVRLMYPEASQGCALKGLFRCAESWPIGQDLFNTLLRGGQIGFGGSRLVDDLESKRWWVILQGQLQPSELGAARCSISTGHRMLYGERGTYLHQGAVFESGSLM